MIDWKQNVIFSGIFLFIVDFDLVPMDFVAC